MIVVSIDRRCAERTFLSLFLLQGPTALGRVPNFTDTIFPPDSLIVIRVASQFGLVVFMFLVGMELDAAEFESNLKSVVAIAGIGVIFPLFMAAPTALLFDKPEYSKTSYFNLILFIGVSMGMSALPVLARILSERGMLTSPLGNLIMGATSIDDVMAWIVLAVVVAIVRSSQELNILWTILMAIGNFGFVIFIIRPVLTHICRKVRRPTDVSQSLFFLIFSVLLINSWLCEAIGLSALVGAFEVGLMLPRNPALLSELSSRLEDFVVIILMPLFFANSGLRTDFALLDSGDVWGLCIVLIVVATASKVVAVMVPARYFGLSWRHSLAFGILMSCKGLVALVVVNFGIDYDVITPKLFSILIVMVLVTSFLTVPLTELVLPLSGFGNGKRSWDADDVEDENGIELTKKTPAELYEENLTKAQLLKCQFRKGGAGAALLNGVGSTSSQLTIFQLPAALPLIGQPVKRDPTRIQFVPHASPGRVCVCLTDLTSTPALLNIASVLIRNSQTTNIAEPSLSTRPTPPLDTAGSQHQLQLDKDDSTASVITAFRPIPQDEQSATRVGTNLKLLLNKDEITDTGVDTAGALNSAVDFYVVPLSGMSATIADALNQLHAMTLRERSHLLLVASTLFHDLIPNTFEESDSRAIRAHLQHLDLPLVTYIDPDLYQRVPSEDVDLPPEVVVISGPGAAEPGSKNNTPSLASRSLFPPSTTMRPRTGSRPNAFTHPAPLIEEEIIESIPPDVTIASSTGHLDRLGKIKMLLPLFHKSAHSSWTLDLARSFAERRAVHITILILDDANTEGMNMPEEDTPYITVIRMHNQAIDLSPPTNTREASKEGHPKEGETTQIGGAAAARILASSSSSVNMSPGEDDTPSSLRQSHAAWQFLEAELLRQSDSSSDDSAPSTPKLDRGQSLTVAPPPSTFDAVLFPDVDMPSEDGDSNTSQLSSQPFDVMWHRILDTSQRAQVPFLLIRATPEYIESFEQPPSSTGATIVQIHLSRDQILASSSSSASATDATIKPSDPIAQPQRIPALRKRNSSAGPKRPLTSCLSLAAFTAPVAIPYAEQSCRFHLFM